MTDKKNHIENRRPVGSECFYIKYTRRSSNNLNFYLDQFNIKDYWIYKYSNKQIEVTVEEFMDFKYVGYIFYKKSLYDKEHINKWINFDNFNYLIRPLPPYDPNKIIIKK